MKAHAIGLRMLNRLQARANQKMARTFRAFLSALFIAFALPHGNAANVASALPHPAEESAWFTQYNASTFRQLPAARQSIDLSHLNQDLLDAAVFHETNRRRQQHGLAPLPYDGTARQMARMQSRAMAQSGLVSHENPEPSKRTMTDRARLAGLRPSFLAENGPASFGGQHKSAAQ